MRVARWHGAVYLCLSALIAGLMSACGGGGGGGDASDGPERPAQALRFTLDGAEGAPPQQADVALPDLPGTSYLDVRAGPGLRADWAFSARGVLLTVYPLFGSEDGLATEVEIRRCAQPACTDVLQATRLPVTVVAPRSLAVVGGGTWILPAALGQALPARTYSLLTPDEPGTLSVALEGVTGPVNWVQPTLEGQRLRLAYSGAEALPKGTHGAVVVLTYARASGRQAFTTRLGVNLLVDDAGCRPLNSTAGDHPIRVYGHQPWETSVLASADTFFCHGVYRDQVTVRAERDGLLLTTNDGTSTQELTVTAAMPLPWIAANLPNGQTSTIAYVLSAPGLPDARVVRSVALDVPEVTSISPTRIAAGQAREIVLRGYMVEGAAADIRVGNLTGLEARRVQCAIQDFFDCTVAVSLPALSPGRYPVSMPFGAMLPLRAPLELVVEP